MTKLRLFILLTLLCFVPPCESRAQQCTEETPCPEVARLTPAIVGGGVAAAPAGGTTLVGNSNVGGNITAIQTTSKAFRFQASASGTSATLKIRLKNADAGTAHNIKVGIYSDSAGEPNTLLASTNSSPTSVAGSFDDWKEITLSGVAITSGTWYWLAFVTDAWQLGVYYDTNYTYGYEKYDTTDPYALPDTWDTEGDDTGDTLLSIYVVD